MRVKWSQDLAHLVDRWIHLLWGPLIDNVLESIIVHAGYLNCHSISSRWHSALRVRIVVHWVNAGVVWTLDFGMLLILILTIVKRIRLHMMSQVSLLTTWIHESNWSSVLGLLMTLLTRFTLEVLLVELWHLVIILTSTLHWLWEVAYLLLTSWFVGVDLYFVLITCPSHAVGVVAWHVLVVGGGSNGPDDVAANFSWAWLWYNYLSFSSNRHLSLLGHVIANHASTCIDVLILPLILILLDVVHVN